MSIQRFIIPLLTLLSLTLILGQGCPSTGPDTGDDGIQDGSDDGSGDGSSDGVDNGDGDSSDGDTASSPTLAAFDELWNRFNDEYSYFSYKGIDWDDVKSRYRSNFEEDLSADVFAQRIGEMLNELHDWHVWVQAPGADAIGYSGSYETNAPQQLITSYTLNNDVYEKIGDNVFFHAWLHDNLAHIVVVTIETTPFQSVSDEDIESLFATYAGAAGMVIDIRYNNGGNENNAAKIASRFTDESFVYGYTETRNAPTDDNGDPNPNYDPSIGFNAPEPNTLEPSTGTHCNGPVVCLIGKKCMSSAEWMTLMMKGCGATLIGDTTRGASGFPKTFTIASNGVTYAVSRWIAYTAQSGELGEVIEDNGIAPDEGYAIPAGEGEGNSYDDTHDYVLEKAIEKLTSGDDDSDDDEDDTGTACTNDFDCEVDEECVDGTCQPIDVSGDECEDDLDCEAIYGEGWICVDGYCDIEM